MKKIFLAMVLVLVMAIPAFADWNYYYGDLNSPQSTTATGGAATIGNVSGGAGGAGGAGGNATIQGGAVKVDNKNINTNLNTNLNNNSNRNENTNVNLNSNRQGQAQGQLQGQGQSQNANNNQSQNVSNDQGQDQFGYVAPVQETNIEIKNPRQYLGAPSVGPAELNFGNGTVNWYFANTLPKIGIPLYQPNEEIKEVLDTTANVPIKRLLPTGLKMKKAQMPLCYNVRLIIVKAEAQKSWTTGGAIGGAGSYVGNAGSAGSASLIPSVGGTKAHDLYTLIIVKVR